MWRIILGLVIIGGFWFYACVVCGARADKRLRELMKREEPAASESENQQPV
jgi:hypothetical protein